MFNPFKRKPATQRRRVEPQMRRGYSAASVSRLLADWTTQNTSADAELKRSLKVLRARSRELGRNNDYGRKFLNMAKTHVVGPKGIRLQSRAVNPDGKPDHHARKTIEAEWAAWGKKGFCTMDGQLSWLEAQKMIIESIARDGEIMIRKVRGRAAGNRWGFALQLMEPDHLDEDYSKPIDGGQIFMGVESNKWRRPTAYHFLSEHPGADPESRSRSTRERVAASDVIHPFIMERPSQSRGIPWGVSAMERLQMLSGYEQAELVAARIAASKMGFYTTPDGEGIGDDEDAAGNLITEAEPGTFEVLPEGYEFQAFDPQHPTTAFADFEKAILRGIASGLNVSYNVLANDLEGVNYSSIRQGVLDERDGWRMLQTWMIETVCEPVFGEWLAMSLDTGAIGLPNFKFDKFANVDWQPRGWQWVDPAKEIKAAGDAVKEGVKTRTEIAAEQGRDFEDVIARLAEENEIAKAAGVDLGADTPAPGPVPVEP